MSMAQSTVTEAKRGLKVNTEGLTDAIKDFQQEPSKESLFAILSFFEPVRDYGMRAVRFTADYSRRHPVRMAISAIAVGLVAAKLLKRKSIA